MPMPNVLESILETLNDAGVINIVDEQGYQSAALTSQLTGAANNTVTKDMLESISDDLMDIMKNRHNMSDNDIFIAKVREAIGKVQFSKEIESLLEKTSKGIGDEIELQKKAELVFEKLLNQLETNEIANSFESIKDEYAGIENLFQYIGIDEQTIEEKIDFHKELSKSVAKSKKSRVKVSDEEEEFETEDDTSNAQANSVIQDIMFNANDGGVNEEYQRGTTVIGDVEVGPFRSLVRASSIHIPKSFEQINNSPTYQKSQTFTSKMVSDVRKIKATNNIDKETGLLAGKRLNKKALTREDGRIFMNINSPEKEEAELSVYALLDLSGSTANGLDQMIKSVGYSLIETCEKLRIKITVIAYNSVISIVKRGKQIDNNKYMLLSNDIHGSGGTSTEEAMKVAYELAKEDKEKDIVVINLTDGEGSGEETGAQLLRTLKNFGKNVDVHAVGMSYGGGSFSIVKAREIYGTNNAHNCLNDAAVNKAVEIIIDKAVLKGDKDGR